MPNITSYKDQNIYKYQTRQTIAQAASAASAASGAARYYDSGNNLYTLSVTGIYDNNNVWHDLRVADVSAASGFYDKDNNHWKYESGAWHCSMSGALTQKVTIGTVESLDIDQIVDLFATGNLTVAEVKKWCKSRKIAYSGTTNKTYAEVKFVFNNKKYVIRCKTAAAESQIDNKTVKTYTKSELSDFSADMLNKYFSVVATEAGVNKYYVLKPDCGYSDIDVLKNDLFTQYKNDLILDNFIAGKNIRTSGKTTTEASKNLYKTSSGTTLSLANFAKYAKEIGLATGDEQIKLRKEALNKLIDQFSQGNLSIEQAKTILDAIGVSYSAKSSNGQYVLSFKFDNKQYKICCNKEAAVSGIDNKTVQTFTADELKTKYNFDKNIINKYFESVQTIGNEVRAYAIKNGFTLEMAIEDYMLNEPDSVEHVYTRSELVDKYNLTREDLDTFFTVAGSGRDTLALNEAMLDMLFPNKKINNIEKLFKELEDFEYTKYVFDTGIISDDYCRYDYINDFDKYGDLFIKTNKNPPSYKMNKSLVNLLFPDFEIKTVGQLIRAVESDKNYVARFYNENNAELKNGLLKSFQKEYNLTEEDFDYAYETIVSEFDSIDSSRLDIVKKIQEYAQNINLYKGKYPELKSCISGLLSKFPPEYMDAVVGIAYSLKNEVNGLSELSNEEFCNFLKTDSFAELAYVVFDGYESVINNEDDFNIDDYNKEDIKNFLEESGIIATANVLYDSTKEILEPNEILNSIFNNTQSRDVFINTLHNKLEESGLEYMTFDEFADVFLEAAEQASPMTYGEVANAISKGNGFISDICKFLGYYDDASGMADVLPNLSDAEEFFGIFEEGSAVGVEYSQYVIKLEKMVKGDWQECSRTAISKTLSYVNKNEYWGHVFGQVPTLATTLTNSMVTGEWDAKTIAEASTTIIAKSAFSAMNIAGLETANGWVWQQVGKAASGITGALVVLAVDFVGNCFTKNDDGKLKFSLKQGLKETWKQYSSMAVGAWQQICDGGQIISNLWKKLWGTYDKHKPESGYLDTIASKHFANRYVISNELSEYFTTTLFPDGMTEERLKYFEEHYPNLLKLLKQAQKGKISDKKLKALSLAEKRVFDGLCEVYKGIKESEEYEKEHMFNGYYVLGGAEELREYAKRLIKEGTAQNYEEACNIISEYLSFNEGYSMEFTKDMFLEMIIDLSTKNDLGIDGLRRRTNDEITRYKNYLEQYNRSNNESEKQDLKAKLDASKAIIQQNAKISNQYAFVEQYGAMLYQSIGKIITVLDGSDSIGLKVDYNNIYDVIKERYEQDCESGMNSFQLMLRNSERLTNVDRLQSALNSKNGTNYDEVTQILEDIQNDNYVHSYSYLDNSMSVGEQLSAAVAELYGDNGTKQQQKFTKTIAGTYVESIQWQILNLQDEKARYAEKNWSSQIGVNRNYYNEEITRYENRIKELETKLEDIGQKAYEYELDYMYAYNKYGEDSAQAKKAYDSYTSYMKNNYEYKNYTVNTFYYA